MTDEQARFEGWAIVEIFGHQRYAGYVTTDAYGQAVMFRIDVPPLDERERVTKYFEMADGGINVPPGSRVKEAPVPGYTKLFGVGAIYGITPCTQEAAVKAVASIQPRKLQVVSLAPERALPQSDREDGEDDEPDESEKESGGDDVHDFHDDDPERHF